MNEELRSKIAKRQEANYEIANRIYAVIEKNPELRFHQILHAMNIQVSDYVKHQYGDIDVINVCKDLFNEESVDTLKRMDDERKKSLDGSFIC